MGAADMADDTTATAGTTTATSTDASSSTAATTTAATSDDANNFPANTPLEQMTSDQRESYWKHYARRNEDRLKQYGGLTLEQLTALREKADRQDALEDELASDKDKAVKEARTAAQSEADARYRPMLVRAEFKAAASGRLDADQLTTILEPLDMSRFLTDSGDVDTDKVQKYVDGIAPAKGRATTAGPTTFGLGTRSPQSPTPGEQGRAMAAKRFGTKS